MSEKLIQQLQSVTNKKKQTQETNIFELFSKVPQWLSAPKIKKPKAKDGIFLYQLKQQSLIRETKTRLINSLSQAKDNISGVKKSISQNKSIRKSKRSSNTSGQKLYSPTIEDVSHLFPRMKNSLSIEKVHSAMKDKNEKALEKIKQAQKKVRNTQENQKKVEQGDRNEVLQENQRKQNQHPVQLSKKYETNLENPKKNRKVIKKNHCKKQRKNEKKINKKEKNIKQSVVSSGQSSESSESEEQKAQEWLRKTFRNKSLKEKYMKNDQNEIIQENRFEKFQIDEIRTQKYAEIDEKKEAARRQHEMKQVFRREKSKKVLKKKENSLKK